MNGPDLRVLRQREEVSAEAMRQLGSRLGWQYGADAAHLKLTGACPDAQRDRAAWDRVAALAASAWTRTACRVAALVLEDARWTP